MCSVLFVWVVALSAAAWGAPWALFGAFGGPGGLSGAPLGQSGTEQASQMSVCCLLLEGLNFVCFLTPQGADTKCGFGPPWVPPGSSFSDLWVLVAAQCRSFLASRFLFGPLWGASRCFGLPVEQFCEPARSRSLDAAA